MESYQLYHMDIVENNSICLDDGFDFFIAAAGSDYRAYQMLNKFKKYNISLKNFFLFDFKERFEDLSQDDIEAYNSYKSFGFKPEIIKCSIMDPSNCIKSLFASKYNLSSDDHIAIDISCFTKPYFFSIIKYLKEQIGVKLITVLYTEPMSYIFNKGHYHSGYGQLSVMEVPGYPGLNTRATEKVLVILLGFEGDLSSFITEDVASDKIILVNGFPAYSQYFKDLSIIKNERLLGNVGTKIEYVKANNPFETFNLLETFKKEHPDAFFNIAPLGSKPMALGACLFSLLDESVRIVYPLPEKYAHKTTKECNYSWSYKISFEDY